MPDSAKWGIPVLSLRTYLQFWAFVCYAVSIGLLLFKKEDKEVLDESEMNTAAVYKTIWNICKLKRSSPPLTQAFPRVIDVANDMILSGSTCACRYPGTPCRALYR
jgi:MFS transporter, PAT family, solute carrier family 33 (acetyl-CoA transportor), member 1